MSRTLAALRTQIVATAGGYLRNMITAGTCSRCFTPVDGMSLCSRCRRDDLTAGLPDARAFMTYASHDEPIQQSGRVMRDYKSHLAPSRRAEQIVTLLAALALKGHRFCPGELVGANPTAWAVVPSLPPKLPDEHKLARILRSLAKRHSVEILLRGIDEPASPRDLDDAHFTVLSRIPKHTHVLLIEDTWTSGGHAQSAALALRASGAENVSLLVLARWLSVDYGATTAAWMKRNLSNTDYDPQVCPWTHDACPS